MSLIVNIYAMDIRKLDLNLLWDASHAFRGRSVTSVAKTLRVSQPTVSFASNKLREALGDELFVRTPARMKSTARAELL
jgi:DNA-binding transcriptional LysR family regulator